MERKRSVPAAAAPRLRRLLPAISTLLHLEPPQVLAPAELGATNAFAASMALQTPLTAASALAVSSRKPTRRQVVKQVYAAADRAGRLVPNADDLKAAEEELQWNAGVVQALWGQRCHPPRKPGRPRLDVGLLAAIFRHKTGGLSMMEPPPAPTKSKKRKKPRKMTMKRIAALLTEGLAEHKEACQTDLAAKDEAIAAQESKLAGLNQGLAALDERDRKKRSKAIAKASNKLARMKQAKNWVQKELDELLTTTINESTYRLRYHKDLKCELGLLGREDYHSFGPQAHAVERMLGGIREARRSITVVVTSLTNSQVAQALVDAQDTNGAVIYVLAERRKVCSSESSVKAFNLLIENEVPVYFVEDRDSIWVRHSLWVVDNRLTFEGLSDVPFDVDQKPTLDIVSWEPDNRRGALGLTFDIQAMIPGVLQQDRLEKENYVSASVLHEEEGAEDSEDDEEAVSDAAITDWQQRAFAVAVGVNGNRGRAGRQGS